jgi:hypothetical protein
MDDIGEGDDVEEATTNEVLVGVAITGVHAFDVLTRRTKIPPRHEEWQQVLQLSEVW